LLRKRRKNLGVHFFAAPCRHLGVWRKVISDIYELRTGQYQRSRVTFIFLLSIRQKRFWR